MSVSVFVAVISYTSIKAKIYMKYGLGSIKSVYIVFFVAIFKDKHIFGPEGRQFTMIGVC